MKKLLYSLIFISFISHITAQNPAIELTKDDQLPYTPQNLAVGNIINYLITVTNTGDVDITNIQIIDLITNPDNFYINNLAVGQQTTLTATYVITQADINTGYICNSATATFTYNGQTYTDISDDTDPASPSGDDDCTMTFLVTPYPSDHDNDTILDDIDIDDDNDGIPDLAEYNGIDPLTDNDNDGIPVYLDDNDNDSSIGNDNSIVESAFDLDGDGIPNHLDLDSDGDSLSDTAESGRLNVPLGTDTDFDGILEGNVGTNGLVDNVEISPDSGTVAYNFLDWDGDGTNDFLDTDDDNDNVPTIYEWPDLNANSYPEDAVDTDGDGNPNYHDIDDDGDGIHTIYEDVSLPNNYPHDGNPMNDDTDGDGIPNYLDTDDDNDGILTIDEHADDNGNGEPEDAIDSNNNGIPDYLDPTNGNSAIENISADIINISPNPVLNQIIIQTKETIRIISASIFNTSGQLIQKINLSNSQSIINVHQLASGMYILQLNTGKSVLQKKFIKR